MTSSGLLGTVTQTPSTNPVVIGTYIDVDCLCHQLRRYDLADALFLVPIDPDTEYVSGSAYGGAYPLTAAYAAQLAVEKGLADLATQPKDAILTTWWRSPGR